MLSLWDYVLDMHADVFTTSSCPVITHEQLLQLHLLVELRFYYFAFNIAPPKGLGYSWIQQIVRNYVADRPAVLFACFDGQQNCVSDAAQTFSGRARCNCASTCTGTTAAARRLGLQSADACAVGTLCEPAAAKDASQ